MPLTKHSVEKPLAHEDGDADSATLLAELHGVDAQARRRAARALAAHPAAGGALCAALAGEAEEQVREAMFTALIRIATPEVVDGLLPMLRSEGVSLRNGAIEALRAMPDVVRGRVEDLLGGPVDVRIFGVAVLGALPPQTSAPRLLRVIAEDPDVNVCCTAVEALTELEDSAVIPALQGSSERFPDEPFFQFSIRTAVARLADV